MPRPKQPTANEKETQRPSCQASAYQRLIDSLYADEPAEEPTEKEQQEQ